NDTYFYLPENKKGRLTMLYSEDTASHKAVVMRDAYQLNGILHRDYPKFNGTYFSGGGGLSSTVYDYALFLQMLLNGGQLNGKRLLSRNTVRMMTTNQIGDISRGLNKFGLGFGLTTEKGSAMLPTPEGVFEWGGMFATTYWVDPKEKIVALLYRQIFPTTLRTLPDKFKVLVYQAIND
ncbi:MAG TPA: serine hydrolase domain-containing protein, partial [Flavitalea sp.]|nr:serine hydrolase domain-containing protein [Flavitalea sp.]